MSNLLHALAPSDVSEEVWVNLGRLVADTSNPSSDYDALRATLEYGTQQQKLDVFGDYGLTLEDMASVHEQLKTVPIQGSLPLWWW